MVEDADSGSAPTWKIWHDGEPVAQSTDVGELEPEARALSFQAGDVVLESPDGVEVTWDRAAERWSAVNSGDAVPGELLSLPSRQHHR